MTASFWDGRYNSDSFAYGTAPNDFLADMAPHLLPNSRVLCLAEGEGRNALFLASLGHTVHCVDMSAVGLAKAQAAAKARSLDSRVTIQVADLAEFEFRDSSWDAVVSIWCHLPMPLRAKVHAGVVRCLVPGGFLILEAYTPLNVGRGTGGPGADMCMTAEELSAETQGLETLALRETEREIHEGQYHNGFSATVQLLARKPFA
ncbi:hypothetical protein HDU83_002021 [Entophlyctis luteolus]|nr:hypothetical protein HDU83_002021 [Entophlyctis luteolus]